MQTTLDTIDHRILALLQEDASLNAADIASRVGLSQSPCWRRIARLERSGLIKRRVALLDRQKLGLGVIVFALVKIARGGKQTLAQFEESVRKFTEVQECYMLMGEMDFLLKVVTRDVASYEAFLRGRLSRLAAVGEVRSSMALTAVKEGTALPLDLIETAGPAGN